MANKYTEYKLDKTRNLRLGMVALNKVKDKLGMSISKIDFTGDVDFYAVAVILWAGMVHEDSELTPDKVMELVDEHSDIPTALKVMGEIMQEAFGSPNAQGTAEVVK